MMYIALYWRDIALSVTIKLSKLSTSSTNHNLKQKTSPLGYMCIPYIFPFNIRTHKINVEID